MKEELKHFEVTPECAEIIEKLHVKYPKYTKASDLITESGTMEDTLLAIRMLLEHGVLMTKEPLKAVSVWFLKDDLGIIQKLKLWKLRYGFVQVSKTKSNESFLLCASC